MVSDNEFGGIWNKLVLTVFLVALLLVIIFMWFLWSLTSPVVNKVYNEFTDGIKNISEDDPDIQLATNSTFIHANVAVQNTGWFGYSMLIGLIIGFIFMCFFVRSYPFLLVFWIVGIFVIAYISIYLSAGYQDIASGSSYVAGIYQAQTSQDYILRYLPHMTVVIGVIGGIVLFVLAARGDEGEAIQ